MYKDTIYSVDQGSNFILTFVPSKDSDLTKFQITYWTDGKEYDWYLQYYYTWFFSSPQGETMMYLAIACVALCLCTLFCCIGFGIKQCCGSSNKIDPSPSKTGGQFAQMNNTSQQSGTEGMNELELESIHGSDDDRRTNNGDLTQPSMHKVSKS